MNGQHFPKKNTKRSPLFWGVLGICAVLTVGLLVFLAVSLVFGGRSEQAGNTRIRYPYSNEEELEYFKGFDATALAAVVCDAYPEADGAVLALGEDENFLRMNVEYSGAQVPLHFSLRSTDMAFTDEFRGYDRGFLYTSRIYENAEAAEELSARYASHLEDRGGDVTGVYFGDFDGDGVDESILLVQGLLDAWLEGAAGSDVQMNAAQALTGKTVGIYLDPDRNRNLTVHSICLPDHASSVVDAVWDNGMVHLVLEDGSILRCLASECALSMADVEEDATALRRICARFSDCLVDQGYTDVRLRLADVSAAPGREVLCCYSDGNSYTVAVFAVRNGMLHTLYRKQGMDGAVYLINQDGKDFLLDYSQTLSDTYVQTYHYCLFRFGESYDMDIADADSLRVEANQGGGSAGSGFFARVNGYLSSSAVCYDPYALMGYTLMQENTDDFGDTQELYLRISNCSTNKVGVITLQDDDSWLNFRSGPSTEYSRVLINNSDPESFVKQVQGSMVTVIMPYNTGNTQNPIWAQIRINYQNKVLEGYSSQRYIRIDGIRHIGIGESVTVTAQTNDTGLRWYCSDTSVAAIGNDGTLTGMQPGLVLVTVISDSGLEDSCLIMID